MKLNGKEISITTPISLKEFLIEQGFSLSVIAVEKNGEIIPKTAYETVLVTEHDKLEVVSFVGGG